MKSTITLRLTIAMLLLAATVAAGRSIARACPFCNAAMQTLSQEIEAADVALIAELASPMPTSASGDGSAVSAAQFRVVQVLRGEDKLEGRKEIDVVYFGDEAPDKQFLVTGLAGVTGPGLDWTTPVPLSEAGIAYVKQLLTIPAQGAERLEFFQTYLEHDDPLLAQDAYDEFARAPYDAVEGLAPKMDRRQLLKWIEDPAVGPSGRRLYFTMLGICGQTADIAMLEDLMSYDYLTMQPGIAAVLAASSALGPAPQVALVDEILHAEERRKRESLDALIACYLRLKGPEGLDLVDRLFLANPKVEFKHLYSAIMALRFHGESTNILPRQRLLESMRLALDHPNIADQVIPDLSRWEDWEVMPRLIAMFMESEKDDWIRQPVVSYLLVAADAPGEAGENAKSELKKLEAVDPETVERARSLSAFNFLARAAAPIASSDSAEATSTDAAATTRAVAGAADVGTSADSAAPPDSDATQAAQSPVESPNAVSPTETVAAASSTPAATPTPPVAAATAAPPSRTKIIGIPLLAAVVLLAIFAVLLHGADPRSSNKS